ncbi:unnamed protein product [Scytosiphon promiscuus]
MLTTKVCILVLFVTGYLVTGGNLRHAFQKLPSSGPSQPTRMFYSGSRAVGGRAAGSAPSFLFPSSRCYGRPPFAPARKGRPAIGEAQARYRRLCFAASRGENEAGSEAKCLGLEITEVLKSRKTRLVLHFDLNKTLIMVDPAGRKSQAQVLNSVLAEICWGRVERGNADQESAWIWDGSKLSRIRFRPPAPESQSRRKCSKADERLYQEPHPQGVPVSYSDFLHGEFGDAEGKDNHRMKEIRDGRKGSFTEDGQPGFGLRTEYLRLERALSLPEAVKNSPLAEGAGLAGRESFYVLPSFFRCLLALKDAGAEFGVVFRTFGDDIVGVSQEYNAFCEGAHPLFPGSKMDGSDGRGDFRLDVGVAEGTTAGSTSCNTIGSFFRDDEGAVLVLGTLNNPLDRGQTRSMERKGHSVYRSIAGIHHAICERVGALDSLPASAPADLALQTFSELPAAADPPSTSDSNSDAATEVVTWDGKRDGVDRRCLALRDYYHFWRENLEAATAGKLLPVDLCENPKVWPIIFDDNIGRPDSNSGAHIVDARDVTTGQPVDFDIALRRHIVRAEPFLAIDQSDVGADGALGSDFNFFLLEILKRLAPERAALYTADSTSVRCTP